MFEQVRHIGVRRRKTPSRLKNSKLSFLRGADAKGDHNFSIRHTRCGEVGIAEKTSV
jgi:hypothetical protein